MLAESRSRGQAVRRGEIYKIDLSNGRSGHETQGERPAIIFSNDVFNGNASWKTVIVIPVTTSVSQARRSYGVVLPAGSAGLPSESVALCHQITTIDRDRIGALYGQLDARLLRSVEDEVRTILRL